MVSRLASLQMQVDQCNVRHPLSEQLLGGSRCCDRTDDDHPRTLEEASKRVGDHESVLDHKDAQAL